MFVAIISLSKGFFKRFLSTPPPPRSGASGNVFAKFPLHVPLYSNLHGGDDHPPGDLWLGALGF